MFPPEREKTPSARKKAVQTPDQSLGFIPPVVAPYIALPGQAGVPRLGAINENKKKGLSVSPGQRVPFNLHTPDAVSLFLMTVESSSHPAPSRLFVGGAKSKYQKQKGNKM